MFLQRYTATQVSSDKASIIIAARNEETNIGHCLESLLAQDFPRSQMEIIVVDDRSTDRTGEILDRLAGEFHQLKVLHVKELPAGWLGKPWACQRLGLNTARVKLVTGQFRRPPQPGEQLTLI